MTGKTKGKLVNGINTALTRPCSECGKHVMWSERLVVRWVAGKRYQLHAACVDDWLHAPTDKEVRDEPVREVPHEAQADQAPRPAPEVLREPGRCPHLRLVPPLPRRAGEADSPDGDAADPVLLDNVVPFPTK